MADRETEDMNEAKTVFAPSALPAATKAATVPPAEEAAASGPPAPVAPAEAPAASAPPAPVPPAEAPAPSTPPAAASGRVEVGAVLNGIYEIRRFVARGGMGEVYEGVNVNDEHDRVAIKVMLPQLAADPNVQAMFRKEARTLTRLSHPAVVQYRVLAQEPRLGVFYIVTEFIDGRSLADLLGELKPDATQLRALTRRLAEGLRTAHELGAVHRDMAPDNVLLPGGRLDRAKIIDFGIAKDLDPSKATIVGDGFAGKLGYVAPEQFGDFGREIGPWTDVYSLGLVILSAAAGRHVDMGATLVEAVDRRRAGPDLSAAPAELRPVLERMLAADPAKRLRSMDEVLAVLDAPVAAAAPKTQFMPAPAAAPATPGRPAPEPAKASAAAAPAARSAGPSLPGRLPLIAGGAVLALVLVGGGLALTLNGSHPHPATASPAGPGAGAAVRQAVTAALPTIGCSWIDLDSVSDGAGGVSVKLKGVAGDVVKAQAALMQAVQSTGAHLQNLDLGDVAPLKDPAVCSRLDVFNSVRADPSAGRRLSTAQTSYELRPSPTDPTPKAHPVVTLALGDPKLGFAVAGLDSTGRLDPVVDRAQIETFAKTYPDAVSRVGDDAYRLGGAVSDAQDWFGTLLLTGQGAFDPKLLTLKPGEGGADWARRFKAAAAQGGWKAEMVWYKVVKPAG